MTNRQTESSQALTDVSNFRVWDCSRNVNIRKFSYINKIRNNFKSQNAYLIFTSVFVIFLCFCRHFTWRKTPNFAVTWQLDTKTRCRKIWLTLDYFDSAVPIVKVVFQFKRSKCEMIFYHPIQFRMARIFIWNRFKWLLTDHVQEGICGQVILKGESSVEVWNENASNLFVWIKYNLKFLKFN